MTFDDLKKIWQSQKQGEIKIDYVVLLKELQRNQKYFEYAIFWRDVREAAVSFIMAIFFFYLALKLHNWTLYLVSLSSIFIGIFLIIDRFVQNKNAAGTNDTLAECIKSSLTKVEHQIWLLKNVFWWYLLPTGIAISLFFSSLGWQSLQIPIQIGGFLFLILVFAGVYYLNQYSVKKELLPRKKELENLLENLNS